MTNEQSRWKATDRLQLLFVGLLCSAYFLPYQVGMDYGSGKAWLPVFPKLEIVGLVLFVTTRFLLRGTWVLAAIIAGNALVMPRLAIGVFFGARDVLHLHWIIAALLALPPLILVFEMLVMMIRLRGKQASGKTGDPSGA